MSIPTMSEKDKSVVLFFIDNNNEPTHATAVAKKSGVISKKWAGERCKHLEREGVLSYKKIRPARQAHETEYYFIASTTDALHQLVAAFNHDPDSQHKFMLSQYYRSMISDLVQQFMGSIPDNDVWKFATHKHAATRYKPLSEEDERHLTDELENNWIALKFVEHFISEGDKRSMIMQQLMETAHNPKISPAAANAAGYTKGVCLGMDKCQQWIKKDKALEYREERLKAEWNNAPFGDHIHWRELFDQLDNLNSNYPYLCD